MTSRDPDTFPPNTSSPESTETRKPFVEPELRHETDLVSSTASRTFFETDGMS